MYAKQGTRAYAQVDLHSRLAGATPHQLITMLFEGAHSAIVRARLYFENGNIAKRGEMISKAINIIDNGLRSALDHEKGGEIARDLEALYSYMSRTLLQANLNNDPSSLAHVDEILMNIAETWKEIESR
ncbi:MAG: flagellar export chaperone FliS [Mixta calida]|uniref:Flagellar secretion chaperone FliS n=1 Tax=Mixta calida TaxID=665913 RepID=A0ABN5H963_9GAMM|nr:MULTISPECIES: flagellar export chaperone FliS [Mixta]MDU3817349.1 flagellar export chaperone FliS [Pantoea sp.]AUY23557.1 flagella export chaperone FliS [Mixta calida]MCR1566072.1 flagellar export chaperone FliS [Mixta sp.]MDU2734075.1 flagellar export chaperone FliS [Mixta calida]MDU3078292.1 flagellar export chaperone FliS [Mixta calida]